MNRRESLKLLPALGIASVWLTNCGTKYVDGFTNLKLSEEDIKIISAIRQSILPIKEEVNAGKSTDFVLKYADQIISTSKRNTFVSGFQALKSKLKGELQYKVSELTPDVIQNFWNDAAKSSELIEGFLSTIKKGAVHYYKTEEPYMTNLVGYKLVPGEFQGCVKIS